MPVILNDCIKLSLKARGRKDITKTTLLWIINIAQVGAETLFADKFEKGMFGFVNFCRQRLFKGMKYIFMASCYEVYNLWVEIIKG